MKTSGTKEWKPNNENCIKGCSNNCRYCYAKGKGKRFKRVTDTTWHIEEPNLRSKRPTKYLEGGVMFPTTHDLHIEHANWWMPFLKGLLEKGNDVLIVSKPQFEAMRLICFDQEIQKHKDQIEFRFTIGTDDEETRKFWEPSAPPINERLGALQLAFMGGYRTSVSMEPLLMRNPTDFIKTFDPFVTETIWIGTMNHMHRSDFKEDEMKWFDEQCYINSSLNMARNYCDLKDNPKICWKDSVQKLLGVGQKC